MSALSRPDYDVVKFVAQSSGATLEQVRLDIMTKLFYTGMSHNEAEALLMLFQALAIDAGIEEPTLDLKLDLSGYRPDPHYDNGGSPQ